MILFADAEGKILNAVQERVFQGAAGSYKLILISPFAESDAVAAAFALPGGKACAPVLMKAEHTLSGIKDAAGNALVARSAYLPSEALRDYGRVKLQFHAHYGGEAGGEVFSFEPYVFTVERGAIESLPASFGDDAYNRLLAAFSSLSADVLNGGYGARSLFSWKEGAVYGKGELVFYADENGGFRILRSRVPDNAAPPYTEEGVNGAYWETALDFAALAKECLAKAQEIEAMAAASAAEAKTSAARAESCAEDLSRLAGMRVEAVESLPETGEEGVLYLLVLGAAQSLFGAYTFGGGEWSKRGEINLNLAGARALSHTLTADGWTDNKQIISPEGLSACEVFVVPDDTSAQIYLACGISAREESGGVAFEALSVPETDIGVTLLAFPSAEQAYAGYYTKSETDAALENTAKIFSGTVTIPASAWQDGAALLTAQSAAAVGRITAESSISVAPAAGHAAAFLACNIRASGQGEGTLAFSADEAPASDVAAEIAVRI